MSTSEVISIKCLLAAVVIKTLIVLLHSNAILEAKRDTLNIKLEFYTQQNIITNHFKILENKTS